jgi:hypothetical protein
MSCVASLTEIVVRAAEQCLIDTGAIRPCSHCGEQLVVAQDDRAEERAYDRAAHLWKAGFRVFQGITESDVRAAVKSALDGIPGCCPTC